MKLKSVGAELEIEYGNGPHSLHVTLTDDDGSAMFVMMPDEAIVVGEFLAFWGRHRIEQEGL